MKTRFTLLLALLITQATQSQTVLLECGQNSGQNFDGWYISPYQLFDAVEFDDHSTTFFSEYGGNYSITLTRKIEEMQNYKLLNILFGFEELHNCLIESVVYYTSTDGKKWQAINNSRNNVVVEVPNDSLEITYVRATATVNFENNGKVACNYTKVEGDLKETPLLSTKEESDLPKDNFYIFSFEHTLNIETQLDQPYEVLITAMSGQIIFREAREGSGRIELPGDLQGIYVVSIIQDNAFKASKKIAL